jgi:hypothetical protein
VTQKEQLIARQGAEMRQKDSAILSGECEAKQAQSEIERLQE